MPSAAGKGLDDPALGFTFEELGLKYNFIQPRRFGDPSLFLDFRATRRWIGTKVRQMVEDTDAERSDDASDVVSVLNAFAYTCGAGVVAADAGAGRVVNTDHSASYLAYGDANAKLNGVPKMDSLCCDFYPAMRQMAGLAMPGRKEMGRGGRGGGRGGREGRGGRGRSDGKSKNNSISAPAKIEPETFDLVILDPPTLTKTRFGAVDIENDYPSLAKPSALCVKPGGVLLATNHSAAVGLDDWLEIVSRCATKAGREVVSVDVIEPDGVDDDDFPPLDDGKRPLKVAAFTLA
jgi:23S rRNA (cytosine1962-C5)-methyltransferase